MGGTVLLLLWSGWSDTLHGGGGGWVEALDVYVAGPDESEDFNP